MAVPVMAASGAGDWHSTGTRLARAWHLPGTHLLGRSVDGRPIVAIERGDPASPRKVLVVGCIHGNEPAGRAIAARLEQLQPPPGVDLWIVPTVNPDGIAAGTRGNAHGVDLNRNLSFGWQPLTGVYYSGPRALSEPESGIVRRLVLRLRPRISVWYHQHLDVVDLSGGDPRIERRYAGLVGEPVLQLPRYPGSVTSWENATMPGTTAFVVELPAGRLSVRAVRRHAAAVLAIAR